MIYPSHIKVSIVSISILLCLLSPFTSVTQAAPTPEQMRLFNQLSPAQRDQILKKISKQSALTPEQAQMFNQLTPAQKAQALEQIEKQKIKKSGIKHFTPIAEPHRVIPLRAPARTDKAIENSALQGTDIPTLEEKKQDKHLKQQLTQFGYDLFSGVPIPTTFAPATDIPIPSEYIIGPGDTVQVQLFGKENVDYDLIVSREGQLRFPGIGPISVAGLRFDALKDMLRQRIKRQMIGVKSNITMGALRSIRVFVLGDAKRPGSYTVSALSNMTNALFVCGGVRDIGSLRNIQLKRSGKVITTLDLYSLLLKGDTSNDVRLLPGDVIFIPPIGKTVGVAGEVRRPAIYELRGEQFISEAIALAGGLLPTAYSKASQLERINARGNRTLIDVDISTAKGLNQGLNDGDVIRVYSVLDRMDDIILMSGHVQRPGAFQWFNGMRVTDVISSINMLLPKPELNYTLIKREVPPDRHIEVVTLNLQAALQDPESVFNLELKPRDEIFIFGQAASTIEEKRKFIDTVVGQLRDQARFDRPERVVTINGNVRHPGDYPLSNDMRLSDLIKAAYDIKPQTDLDYTLISREIESGERLKVFSASLRNVFSQPDSKFNIALKERDTVYVFAVGEGRQEQIKPIIERLKKQARHEQLSEIVSVDGLVTEPGVYPLDHMMRVSQLIRAAGGLTESAYTLNAELSRYQIIDGKYRQVEHFTVNQSDIFDGNVATDILLEPYDRLRIKRVPQWSEQQSIEIKGEVTFPGTYVFRRGETLYDVIKRAGGLTQYAFAEGAVFMRTDLQKKEQEQLNVMAKRLESDLAAVSLEKSQAGKDAKTDVQSVALAQSLLGELKGTRAMGRLVIDLKQILSLVDENGEAPQKVALKDGDKLFVPAKTQEVTIIGEVQQITSHLYSEYKSRDDYIAMSGGLTHKADNDRIYIVRANGAVISDESTGWFGDSDEVRPGDTIVVPLDAERMKPLTFWTSIVQIVYQLGIAAAAWNTVGVF